MGADIVIYSNVANHPIEVRGPYLLIEPGATVEISVRQASSVRPLITAGKLVEQSETAEGSK